jgi:hypothetical protein
MVQICFGKHTLITKEARAWIDHIDKFELSYNARFKTVLDFRAKLLGIIDLTFFFRFVILVSKQKHLMM